MSETIFQQANLYQIISNIALPADRPDRRSFELTLFRLDMFHDQLPLAVPCYDLLLVIEFAVVLDKPRYRAPPTSLS